MKKIEISRYGIPIRQFIGDYACYYDLRHFTFMVCMAKEDQTDIRNILPNVSLKKNVEHHPIRILRELGYTVEIYK